MHKFTKALQGCLAHPCIFWYMPIHFVPNVIRTATTKAVKSKTRKSWCLSNDFNLIPQETGHENMLQVMLAFKQTSSGTTCYQQFQIFSISSLLIFLNATGLACFKEVLEMSVCMVDMAMVSQSSSRDRKSQKLKKNCKSL